MGKGSGMRSMRAVRSAAILTIETLEGRRLLSAGQLDTVFGTGGVVTTTFQGPSQDSLSASIQTSHGLVVVGNNSNAATIVRYDVDGNRDLSFGHAGVTY